jgi:predicted  nucleic acid-binding Zn-ribbon protein
MECEESFSKLQAERRLCAQLEHSAADLRSQNATVEQEITVARAELQQLQASLSALAQQLQIEQQKVASARLEHDSLQQEVASLTLGIQDFVSQLTNFNAFAGDFSSPAELPSSAPPLLQPLLDQLQRMCASFALATSRQQLESEQPLASTSDMLQVSTEMADLRLRLQALQAQALEAEQRWRRAEAAAAAAESRLSESTQVHDSAYQSALAQIRDSKDALAFKFDQQQQRIRELCSRLRSSLSPMLLEPSESAHGSRDSIDQLESLLGSVEAALQHAHHSSAADAAATPASVRPHATPLMGGVGASTIASAASTASRFSTPLPHKDSEYLPKGVGRNQHLHSAPGNGAEESVRWLELQLAVCRQEVSAMESRCVQPHSSAPLSSVVVFFLGTSTPWSRLPAGALNECVGSLGLALLASNIMLCACRKSCCDASLRSTPGWPSPKRGASCVWPLLATTS